MSKQTAVEWLVNEIKLARELCDDPYIEMDIWYTLDLLIAKEEQAKEMEKEQHKTTFRAILNTHYFDFEQYYNETFNKKEAN